MTPTSANTASELTSPAECWSPPRRSQAPARAAGAMEGTRQELWVKSMRPRTSGGRPVRGKDDCGCASVARWLTSLGTPVTRARTAVPLMG